MPKQPFYKIGSVFNQIGNTKDDRIKGVGPVFKTYTDPKTNKQG